MRNTTRLRLAAVVIALSALPLAAQQAPVVAPPTAPAGIAATVNGQPIMERAIERSLRGRDNKKYEQVRAELINYQIDNVLIDQYLQQAGIKVEQKDIDARVQQLRTEIEKDGQKYDEVLKTLLLTEDELRMQIAGDQRWELFVSQKATDAALKELFAKEKVMFDGTLVRARHILLTPATKDAQAAEEARKQLLLIKQDIERKVAEGVAKLPATLGALERERERIKLLEEAFSDAAREKSSCPSKERGGDVSWFPRGGSMVEPFARAAFALQKSQMSDVVQTPYGFHLILATDRKDGLATEFDTVKDEVKEVYSSRLRAALSAQLRPTARITINPAPPASTAPAQPQRP